MRHNVTYNIFFDMNMKNRQDFTEGDRKNIVITVIGVSHLVQRHNLFTYFTTQKIFFYLVKYVNKLCLWTR